MKGAGLKRNTRAPIPAIIPYALCSFGLVAQGSDAIVS